MDVPSKIKASLYFLKQGWPVIYCDQEIKKPLLKDWVNTASLDEKIVTQWWQNNPNYNIALLTGKKSGFFVLDIDGDIGKESIHDLQMKYGDLPETIKVQTGSLGLHYYFKYPLNQEIRNKTALFEGIDVRGDGGCVFAPPSKFNTHSNPYKFIHSPKTHTLSDAPEWLLNFLKETPKIINNLSDHALLIIEGQRNDLINKKAWNLRWELNQDKELVTKTILEFNEKNCSPPLPKNEILTILNSVFKSPKIAKIYEQREEVNDFNVQTILDATEDKITPIDWVYEDFLNKKSYFLFAADEKTGKSYFVTELSIRASIGSPFLGFECDGPKRVLYLQKEVDNNHLLRRVNKYLEELSEKEALLSSRNFFFQTVGFKLKLDGNTSWLDTYLQKYKPDLLILDNLNRFTDMDTSKQQDMMPIMDLLQERVQKYNTCILLVHHTSKAQDIDIWAKIRGSKTLVEAPDGIFTSEEVLPKNIPVPLQNKVYVRKMYFKMRNVLNSPPIITYVEPEDIRVKRYTEEKYSLDIPIKTSTILNELYTYIKDNPGQSYKEICTFFNQYSNRTISRYLTKAKDRCLIFNQKKDKFNESGWFVRDIGTPVPTGNPINNQISRDTVRTTPVPTEKDEQNQVLSHTIYNNIESLAVQNLTKKSVGTKPCVPTAVPTDSTGITNKDVGNSKRMEQYPKTLALLKMIKEVFPETTLQYLKMDPKKEN